MLASKRLELDFMYSAVDGSAVRLVMALWHKTNPKVSPHGVGVLIQNLFSRDGKGFAPVLALLEDSVLVVALAHIARYRVSIEPNKDMFSPFEPLVGDVGSELATIVVEWVRFTSCHKMLDGLQNDLEHEGLRQSVRRYNEKFCEHAGIPFVYDVEGREEYSRDKWGTNVSALFQVRERRPEPLAFHRPDARTGRPRPRCSRTGRQPPRWSASWRSCTCSSATTTTA